jgi:flagellar basal body P-ring protein FlgI
MKRVKNVLAWSTVICLLSGLASQAQQEPPGLPETATAAAEVAPPGRSAEAPGASIPPAVAEALAKIRQKGTSDRLKIGDICQVKHYRQETLRGFGLVLDLEQMVGKPRSTTAEEEDTPPAMELAELLALLNKSAGEAETSIPKELQDAGLLTLVAVTAAVPPEGVRKGDRIDCEVKAFDGTNLENGYLFTTRLATPGPREDGGSAVACGPIVSEGSYRSGPAKVSGGCLVETDVCDEFIKDDKITLILDLEHADFLVVQDMVDLINTDMGAMVQQPLAKALNRFNVEVAVPSQYAEDPVAFVTMILQLQTQIPAPEKEE